MEQHLDYLRVQNLEFCIYVLWGNLFLWFCWLFTWTTCSRLTDIVSSRGIGRLPFWRRLRRKRLPSFLSAIPLHLKTRRMVVQSKMVHRSRSWMCKRKSIWLRPQVMRTLLQYVIKRPCTVTNAWMLMCRRSELPLLTVLAAIHPLL